MQMQGLVKNKRSHIALVLYHLINVELKKSDAFGWDIYYEVHEENLQKQDKNLERCACLTEISEGFPVLNILSTIKLNS